MVTLCMAKVAAKSGATGSISATAGSKKEIAIPAAAAAAAAEAISLVSSSSGGGASSSSSLRSGDTGTANSSGGSVLLQKQATSTFGHFIQQPFCQCLLNRDLIDKYYKRTTIDLDKHGLEARSKQEFVPPDIKPLPAFL